MPISIYYQHIYVNTTLPLLTIQGTCRQVFTPYRVPRADVPLTGTGEQVSAPLAVCAHAVAAYSCTVRSCCCEYTRRRGAYYSRGGRVGLTGSGASPWATLSCPLLRLWACACLLGQLKVVACWTHTDNVVLPKLVCTYSLEVPGRHAW